MMVTQRSGQTRGAVTRQRILDEALRRFARYGFDGVGIRDIADAVGVNHGLIKYHFGTKDKLWRAAVSLLFERVGSVLTLAEEDVALPVERQFENGLRRYVRYCAQYPEHARLMVQESFRDNERLEWAVSNFIVPDHARFTTVIRALMRRGLMPKRDPIMMIYALTGATQALFSLAAEVRIAHDVDAMSDDVIERYADTIIGLFMPGLAVSSPKE